MPRSGSRSVSDSCGEYGAVSALGERARRRPPVRTTLGSDLIVAVLAGVLAGMLVASAILFAPGRRLQRAIIAP